MRLTAYTGASALLAVAVVFRAFNERPNFFSASVYLAQSNACRMILLNLLLLSTGGLMFGLQRFLYGPLRPIEIEQLWDKAWYAITETALAMTTFRDEIGGWFFLMFVSLLSGKVWQWISEGRVEILEQQPPANPRLFHIRLVSSLILSELFDILMLRYCVQALLDQPKPGMMVMFAFEFAVLAISSSSTAARYSLSLHESYIIKRQTMFKLEQRREELLAAREEALNQNRGENAGLHEVDVSSSDIIIDEDDVDVPGWQEKGRWILFLDLLTDFLKLLVYIGFFTILLMFHGIPIHIIRDVFVTARSFLKRISDFVKYRNATRDMNARYADATIAELGENGTCIICREEMRLWQQPEPIQRPAVGAQQGRRDDVLDERQRPKRLPCGHILHFGCLRSWLERQQVCPTCRSSVIRAEPTARTNTVVQVQNNGGPANTEQIPQDNSNPGREGYRVQQGQNNPQRRTERRNEGRARTLNLGPWRITLAAGNEQQVHNTLQQLREQTINDPSSEVRGSAMMERVNFNHNQLTQEQDNISLQHQINAIERRIFRDIQSLNVAQEQLATVHTLQGELARLGNLQSLSEQQHSNPSHQHNSRSEHSVPFAHAYNNDVINPAQNRDGYTASPSLPNSHQLHHSYTSVLPQQMYFSIDSQEGSGSEPGGLPTGLVLPEGWVLLPLRNMTGQRHGELRNLSSYGSAADLSPLNHALAPVSHGDENLYAEPSAAATMSPIRADKNNQSRAGTTVRGSGYQSNEEHTDASSGHCSFAEGASQPVNSMNSVSPSDKANKQESSNSVLHYPSCSISARHDDETGSVAEASSRSRDTSFEGTENERSQRNSVKNGKGKAKNVSLEDAFDE